jgi:hypothetical protein
MAIERSRVETNIELSTEHHAGIKEKAEDFLQDFSGEVKVEMAEMQLGELPGETSEADHFLRRHVLGLILILFGIAALILLLGIAAIAIYGHHPGHTPGMLLTNLPREIWGRF